ncbi:ROK family protein [Mucilaginibacter sp. PAMB04274]|uniref:ROK family protein n=1 Tax=Mucilaginibacter sp. PAMB04274 TaxID=3138568 RepID=UPI0031F6C791
MKIPSEEKFIISADIGGSHITVAVIDLLNKTILKDTRTRRPVNAQDSADRILSAWSDAIKAVLTVFPEKIMRLALAMPGPFNYETGVSFIKGLHKYELLYGINVKEGLASLLKLEPENIRFRNDAEALVHGEVMAGSGQDCSRLIGFTLGTGMGSAVSMAGVTTDANWGSECFGSSIADDYFSTRWFLKAYSLLAGVSCNNVKDLAELADVDSNASSVFLSFARSFAAFITDKVVSHQPQKVLIGGNIAKSKHLFLNELQIQLAPYIDPNFVVTDLLGEDAALIGAAFTFEHNLHNQSKS